MPEDEPLSTEALMAANESLADRIKTTIPPPTEKRKPGRPAGSKNKGTDGTVKPNVVIPPGERGSRDGPPRLSNEAKAANKKRKAKEYSEKIAEEVNDYLMSLFMAAGVPAAALYKPGMEPQAAKVSNKYTDLGNQLALGPMQSEAFGRFLAELESTDLGTKAAGMVTGDSKLPLVFYGIMSVGAGVQYLKGVKEVMDRMAPLIKAQQEAKAREGTTNE